MDRYERAVEISRLLAETYPEARCELDYQSPWQLLVATVLSAQCTDKRVNLVTPELFHRWPTVADLAAACAEEIASVIRPTGFFRSKASSLKESARILVAQHSSAVPADFDALRKLPGVGPKTAKVVLGEAFKIPAGIAVDTHVQRLSRRFGLASEQDPERIASELEGLVPQEEWIAFGLRVILHGRRVCSARAPHCVEWSLEATCLKRGVEPGAVSQGGGPRKP
jgi:endonuclease-3